jgi:hypothetical protein
LLAVAETLSVAVTCTEEGVLEPVVGVPLMIPVAEAMVIPDGSPVADQV